MIDSATRVLGLPFRIGAAVRRARFFHPNGILATGRIDRTADPSVGLPIGSGRVTVRLSKGIGIPSGLPDVGGIAIRLPGTDLAPGPWDLLLATAGTNPVARCVPLPTLSWSRARFSTLMPYAYADRSWWLQAQLATSVAGLSLDGIEAHLRKQPLVVYLRQAAGTSGFTALARITLDTVASTDDDEAPSFDPVLNIPDGVRLQPEWLRVSRESAYDNSRRGRHSD